MLEGLLRSFNDMYGLTYVALRYFNVYGPRMDIHGKYTEVLIRWMERIAPGQPPLILGDGKTSMDFVYIDDVARANIAGAASRTCRDEVFNVASRRRDQAQRSRRRAAARDGLEARSPSTAPSARSTPCSRRLAGTEKAEAPARLRKRRVDLEEGLSRLVDWWRANKEHGGS